MIIKNFEVNKINLRLNKLILLYGKNEGYKNQVIKNIINDQKNIFKYEEREILDSPEVFIENLLSSSLFEPKKIIIIKRVTDKILKIIEEIREIKLDDVTIVFIAENLEKRSKLRSSFEKNKRDVCVAFYPDNEQTLSRLAFNFFKEKNIPISQSNINSILVKSNGDRQALFNELQKIEYYAANGKKITSEKLTKIVNLQEDHDVSELIDNCLAKNKKKIIIILNENNFSSEDCILIIRVFLNKSKKLLKLLYEYEYNNNIDLTISTAKPPIFWKDKEITKQQIYKWTLDNVKELIYKLGELELQVKTNINNSVNLILNFILEQTDSKTNN